MEATPGDDVGSGETTGFNAKAQRRRGARVRERKMTENEISRIIVEAAIEVHREMGGPGLLEDVYEEALAEELRMRGVPVERQLPVRLTYKGRILRKPLRLDMKVDGNVLVDNKAVSEWHPVFSRKC
jgi:GxxExxY protein